MNFLESIYQKIPINTLSDFAAGVDYLPYDEATIIDWPKYIGKVIQDPPHRFLDATLGYISKNPECDITERGSGWIPNLNAEVEMRLFVGCLGKIAAELPSLKLWSATDLTHFYDARGNPNNLVTCHWTMDPHVTSGYYKSNYAGVAREFPILTSVNLGDFSTWMQSQRGIGVLMQTQQAIPTSIFESTVPRNRINMRRMEY